MIRAWRVNVYFAVLLMPAGQLKTLFETRRYVRPLLKSPHCKRWSPATIAMVAAAMMMRDHISNQATAGDRARCLDRLHSSPMDLGEELQWLPKVGRGEVSIKSMPPLDFRITWMSALGSRWLIDKHIDLYAKSLFVDMVAYALAEMPNEAFDTLLGDRVPKIGPPLAQAA